MSGQGTPFIMGAVGGDTTAPTVFIETVLVIRPIKIIGLLSGVIAILLLTLSIAASAWLHADGAREGLWEKCTYNKTTSDWVDCHKALPHEWMPICQSLCLISVIICIIAVVITSLALTSINFQAKYKLYWVGLLCFLLAVLLELISLVIFPIKFLDEIDNREQAHWSFGWAYIIGWAGAVTEFAAGLLLLIDRGAEEIIYREKVVHEEIKNGLEAGGNRAVVEASTNV